MTTLYSSVIFDLFGTLVPTYRHHDVLAEMALALGVDSTAFTPVFATELRDERETGKTTLEETLRIACRRLGHTASGAQIEGAVGIRRRFTRASMVPRGDALQALSELKGMGISIGLISDCCEVVSELWESTALAQYIDAPILSVRVGVRKPERRIYDLACAALSVEPARCLYVGDGGSHELTGAVRAGMDAVLLMVESESGLDVYRPDARTWKGPTIRFLSELVENLRDNRRLTRHCGGRGHA